MPISSDILKRFRRPVFIETGTLYGDGTNAALDAGFKWVHSIEASGSLASDAKTRFLGKPVDVWTGDSGLILGSVLSIVYCPVTFFLDAHGDYNPDARYAAYCPLLLELRQIKESGRQGDIILIDDLKLLGNDLPVQLSDVKEAVLAIDPSYKFSSTGIHSDDDILVCMTEAACLSAIKT